MKNNMHLFLLIIMTLFGAFGGYYTKKYSLNPRKITIIFGLALYGFGALINIYLLKKLPLTLVYPANALTYVWTIIIAKVFLKENIGLLKVIGAIAIFLGIQCMLIY